MLWTLWVSVKATLFSPVEGAEYKTVDVLRDDDMREEIKKFAYVLLLTGTYGTATGLPSLLCISMANLLVAVTCFLRIIWMES